MSALRGRLGAAHASWCRWRWLERGAGRVAPGQRVGVVAAQHDPAAGLLPLQDRLDLIAIDFPKIRDGRGFSLARALRDQGYKGTLRAPAP